MAKKIIAGKMTAQDMRRQMLVQMRSTFTELSMDLNQSYDIDVSGRETPFWTSDMSPGDNIVVGRGIVNSVAKFSLNLAYKALVEQPEKVEAARRVYKGIKSLMRAKHDILNLSAYELSRCGQTWGSIERIKFVHPDAIELFEALQNFARRAPPIMSQIPQPNPIRNEDLLASSFLLSMSKIWSTKSGGKKPGKGQSGPFVRYASSAWTDLKFPLVNQLGQPVEDVHEWIGNKWAEVANYKSKKTIAEPILSELE